ncbi:MAG: 16S rRNA (cytidine(1402)-2'-O)-methyltransferase [Gloeomargaritaceae cyanobacterium C42_A2020_066]|nr:16S rRNA (cytidine(1402)-2'-O)-methyltransferase [Gloeomargaritaceae cyanobacterium C42_A2020_066]
MADPGTLYLVGTPIGNLEDISLRALRILRDVDLIAAEDTRHTGRLLQHFQINTPQISYHAHNRQQRQPHLLEHLQAGRSLALVTDAGMPGIADPGVDLVQVCTATGIPVVPIPGPCAAITALCASGLPTDQFLFVGFLPPKTTARRQTLQRLADQTATLILYEAPHRLVATLTDCAAILNAGRPCVVARELTKRYETLWRGTLAAALDHYRQETPKGEVTLLLGGAVPTLVSVDEQVTTQIQAGLAAGRPVGEVVRELVAATGLPHRQLYRLALELRAAQTELEP